MIIITNIYGVLTSFQPLFILVPLRSRKNLPNSRDYDSVQIRNLC